MPRPFRGEIKLDVRDSTPDWDAFLPDRAPEGAPERARRAVRRHRPARRGRPTAVGSTCRRWTGWPTTASPTPSGTRRRCARRPARRSSPGATTTRTGSPRSPSPSTGFPGYNSHIPPENATMAHRAARRRVEHVLGRQEPQRARRRVDDGGVEEELAARPWATTASTASSAARPTTGIPTWPRTTTTSTSPTCPRTATTCPRTWPTRRCEFIRDSKQSEPDKPWYLWFCPGANHAPHHAPAGVHRQVQGQVRRRLRGLPRVGAAPDDRAGHPARGHRAHADQPDARGHLQRGRRGAPVGHAVRRREARCSAAWPRSTPGSPSTPTPRSAASSTTSRSRASSTTRSSSTAPTTAPRARAAPTARSTRTSSSTAIPTRSRTTCR